MRLIAGWKRFFRLPDAAAEAEEEVRFHLAERVRELMAGGVAESVARAQADAEFGDVATVRDALCRMDGRARRRRSRSERVRGLWHDLRHALRALRRQPVFAASAVLTLGLGVAANATMFGVLDRLLLRAPPGVRQPDAVVRLFLEQPTPAGVLPEDATTYENYQLLRDHVRGLDPVALYFSVEGRLRNGDAIRRVRETGVTPRYFELLGVRPALGRLFLDDDDALPAGQPVIVLTHAFWQRAFASDPAVLGRRVQVGDRDCTVIGVTPADFAGIDLDATDIFLPFSALAWPSVGARWAQPRSWIGAHIVGRLVAGVSHAQAAAQVSSALASLPADARPARVLLWPLIAGRSALRSGSGELALAARIAEWLLAMAAIVLLIACSNVANLYLIRALRRQREFAMRMALGAGRGRLTRLLLAEGLLVAAAGSTLGLVLTALVSSTLRRLLLPRVAWYGRAVDGRVLAFTLVVTVVVTLLTSLTPALRLRSGALFAGLRTGLRDTGPRPSLTRRLLLVGQVSLCTLLLVLAGLFLSSLHRALTVDMGFDADNLVAVTRDLPPTAPAAELAAFWDQALRRVAALPGVAHAGVATGLPFWASSALQVTRENGDSAGNITITAITPGYAQAMGLRLLGGRLFSSADGPGSEAVALVSGSLAARLWPGAEPLGRCFHVEGGTGCVRVVGVVRAAHWFDLAGEDGMQEQIWLPLAQRADFSPNRALMVRLAVPPAVALPALRRTLLALAPEGDARIVEMRDLLARPLQPYRMGAALFVSFGALALLIALVGVYGVVACQVNERVREFGVRIALGARPTGLLAHVLGYSMGVGLAGVLIGLLLAALSGPRVRPLLFHMSALEPAIFGVTGGALLLVVAIATLLPAARAARTDPLTLLRVE